jgi:hypothetical protein
VTTPGYQESAHPTGLSPGSRGFIAPADNVTLLTLPKPNRNAEVPVELLTNVSRRLSDSRGTANRVKPCLKLNIVGTQGNVEGGGK